VLTSGLRLAVEAVLRLRRSRLGRWVLAVGSGVVVIALALLAARHFATTSWPLSNGYPGLLVAAGLLLLVAQALKAYGWGRLFTSDERPKPLALAAGNGGAALIGLVLPAASMTRCGSLSPAATHPVLSAFVRSASPSSCSA
jgi:hypothetical protein